MTLEEFRKRTNRLQLKQQRMTFHDEVIEDFGSAFNEETTDMLLAFEAFTDEVYDLLYPSKDDPQVDAEEVAAKIKAFAKKHDINMTTLDKLAIAMEAETAVVEIGLEELIMQGLVTALSDDECTIRFEKEQE